MRARPTILATRLTPVALLVGLMCVGCFDATAPTIRWPIDDALRIPTISTDWNEGFAISESGHVVGGVVKSGGSRIIFLLKNDELSFLSMPGAGTFEPWAVNSHGSIVGTFKRNQVRGNGIVLWKAGSPFVLDSLARSTAYQKVLLNDHETVVWTERIGHGDATHVVRYSGNIDTLPSLGGGASFAHYLHNNGDVVGWSRNATGNRRAVVWRQGAIHDLGTLGGTTSEAYAINHDGVIVGKSQTATSHNHAFMVTGGTMIDLTPSFEGSSEAVAVSSSRTVVGLTSSETVRGAFRWEAGETIMLETGNLAVLSITLGKNELAVGNLVMNGAVRPFAWSGGQVRLLDIGDAMHGTVLRVNAGGTAVGWVNNEDLRRTAIWQVRN